MGSHLEWCQRGVLGKCVGVKVGVKMRSRGVLMVNVGPRVHAKVNVIDVVCASFHAGSR